MGALENMEQNDQTPDQDSAFETVVNTKGELVTRKKKIANPEKDTASVAQIVYALLRLSAAGLVVVIILAMRAGEGALGFISFIVLFGVIFIILVAVGSVTAYSASKQYKKLNVAEPKVVRSLGNFSKIGAVLLAAYIVFQLVGLHKQKKAETDHMNLVAQFAVTAEHTVHRAGFAGMECFVEFDDGRFVDLKVSENSTQYEVDKPICDRMAEQITGHTVIVKNGNGDAHTGDVYFEGKLLNAMFVSK